ncbi:hypothetical protein ACWEGE_05435 [Amycolatopsis sp. NPDC004747]
MPVTHCVRHGLVRALAAGHDRADRRPVVLLPGLAGPTFPPPLRGLGRLSGALLRDLVHESPAALPGTVPYYFRAGPRRLLRFVKSAQRDAPERAIPLTRCPVQVLRG